MLVRGGGQVGRADDRVDSDREARSFFQKCLAAGECTEADFGALQIEQNAWPHSQFSGCAANDGDQGAALFACAMRGIETEDIDACLEQEANGVARIAHRAKSGYYFGGAAAESHADFSSPQ